MYIVHIILKCANITDYIWTFRYFDKIMNGVMRCMPEKYLLYTGTARRVKVANVYENTG